MLIKNMHEKIINCQILEINLEPSKCLKSNTSSFAPTQCTAIISSLASLLLIFMAFFSLALIALCRKKALMTSTESHLEAESDQGLSYIPSVRG